MANGKCSKCEIVLKENNCRPSILKLGYGLCRLCHGAYQREYSKRNPDKIKNIYIREYRKNHKKRLASKKVYYGAHRNRILELAKIYRRTLRGQHNSLKAALRIEKIPPTDPLWNFNYYKEFIKDGVCHYCSRSIDSTASHSLDRKENKIGHFCFNVVLCCWRCNDFKSDDISYEEMMLFAPVLREIRLKREQKVELSNGNHTSTC